MEVTEGAVTVGVPEQPEDGVGDAVFYNLEQEPNRFLPLIVVSFGWFQSRFGVAQACFFQQMAATWDRVLDVVAIDEQILDES